MMLLQEQLLLQLLAIVCRTAKFGGPLNLIGVFSFC